MRQLIAEAGLEETLAAAGPITIFAPSNQAIETLVAAPGGAELLADPERLRDLLLGHVVADGLDSAAVFAVDELTAANESLLAVDAENQTVGGGKLLVADVEAANGFLHVVDRVLGVS